MLMSGAGYINISRYIKVLFYVCTQHIHAVKLKS